MFLNIFKGRKKTYFIVEIILFIMLVGYTIFSTISDNFMAYMLFLLSSLIYFFRALENFYRKQSIIMCILSIVITLFFYLR